MSEDGEASRGATRRNRQRLGLSAVAGAVALVVFTAVVTPIGQRVVDGIFNKQSAGPNGSLEIVDMTVTNNSAANVGITPAILDIKVQNTGTARVVLKSATLVVEDSLNIDECYTQGDMAITGTYDVQLPKTVKPNDTFRVRLNQDEAPDEADRFLIRIQQPPDEHAAPGLSFYRLKVTIESNGNPTAVEVGAAIVALPFPPDGKDKFFWGSFWAAEGDDFSYADGGSGTVLKCMHDNSAKIGKFLALSGSRSGVLDALKADIR